MTDSSNNTVQLGGTLMGIKVRPAKNDDDAGPMAEITFVVNASAEVARLLVYVGYAATVVVQPLQYDMTPLEHAIVDASQEVVTTATNGTITNDRRRR